MKKQKDKLYKIWKKLNTKDSELNYKNENKKYKKQLKTSEINNYKNQISQNINNSKKLWRTIKEVSNFKQISTHTSIEELEYGNRKAVKSEEMRDILNDYYVNIPYEIGQNMPHYQYHNIHNKHNKSNINNSIYMEKTNNEELKTVYVILKLTKKQVIHF